MNNFDKKMGAAVAHWDVMSPVLSAPTNEAEYDALVGRMDALRDYLGADEDHPLNGLLHLMGDLVAAYDEEQYGSVAEATGVEMLKHLMVEHSLKQSDLREIGSQGVVSEILNGHRELNVRQIRLLSQRFGVPAGVFV